MALLIRGKSLCALCGLTIDNGDPVVSFPAFTANQRDPLFHFSDGAFHRRCIERDDDASEALHRSTELLNRLGPGSRPCVVCGAQIRDPDDYLALGFLTADESLLAHEFNFVQVHRSHAHEWPELGRARQALDQLIASGTWEPIKPLSDLEMLLAGYDW